MHKRKKREGAEQKRAYRRRGRASASRTQGEQLSSDVKPDDPPKHVTPDTCTRGQPVKKESEEMVYMGEKALTSSDISLNEFRPTSFECHWAVDALAKLHPEVVQRNSQRRREFSASCGGQDTILDGVVSTMLSQNTTSANSTEAFRRLKRAYPTWESYMLDTDECKVKKLEASIRVGGLSEIKAGRIDAMLETLQEERASVSLEFLRDLSDDQVKSELLRFKGLGPKTISCVLLFAMGRPDFPVDTHVHRISKSLGWVGSTSTAEGAYEHLNATVPESIKLDLHCLMIAHGKVCHRCAARGKPQFPPNDGSRLECPLIQIHKTKGLTAPKVKILEVLIKKEEGM